MCKRYNNLKDIILSRQNVLEAEHNARKGKANTYGVKRFDNHNEFTLDKIIKSLNDGVYKTSSYRIFTIHEPKERIIYQLPYYPDRIVHHILMNVLEPIFVNWFTRNTYSCIKGRGIHKLQLAVEKALHGHPLNTQWCLKLDIRKFYPSIDRGILLSILNKKIKDSWVMNILREIIYSVDNGVPIGNYLSLFFANVYLNDVDHWAKETLKLKYYYRYCDDIVIFGDSSKQLYKVYRLINQKLSFLKLKLKKPRIFPTDTGVDFVGYVFRRTHTLLRKQMKIKFKRLARKYIKYRCDKYKRSISSYYGWIIHCNGIHLLKLNIELLYYDLKNIILKTTELGSVKWEDIEKVQPATDGFICFVDYKQTTKIIDDQEEPCLIGYYIQTDFKLRPSYKEIINFIVSNEYPNGKENQLLRKGVYDPYDEEYIEYYNNVETITDEIKTLLKI